MKSAKSVLLLLCLFSVLSLPLAAEEDLQENLKTRNFSIDFSLLALGLSQGGWGLGFSYEQYIAFHSAIKGNFGHCTFIRDGDLMPTVTFGLAAEYYPLSRSLDKLYLVIGGGLDYIAFTTDIHSDEVKTTFISISPALGWKWQINRFVATDIYAGYKYLFVSDDDKLPSDYERYLRHGVTFGVGVKLRPIQFIRSLREQEQGT